MTCNETRIKHIRFSQFRCSVTQPIGVMVGHQMYDVEFKKN